MEIDWIIERMKEGYRLEYASVSGGQWLSRDTFEEPIGLSFEEFDAVRKDTRVAYIGTQQQGHSVVRGCVDEYRLRQPHDEYFETENDYIAGNGYPMGNDSCLVSGSTNMKSVKGM